MKGTSEIENVPNLSVQHIPRQQPQQIDDFRARQFFDQPRVARADTWKFRHRREKREQYFRTQIRSPSLARSAGTVYGAIERKGIANTTILRFTGREPGSISFSWERT